MGQTINGKKLSVPESMTSTRAEFTTALTNVAEAKNAEEAKAAAVEVVQRMVLERATHGGDSVFEGELDALQAVDGLNRAAFASELPADQKAQAQQTASQSLPEDIRQSVVAQFEQRAQQGGSAMPEAAEEILEAALILGAERASPSSTAGAVQTLNDAGFTGDDIAILDK
jgi:hypothetical protein